jgi:2-oxoglutarate ferredoxin oxidoreductase subunit delta
MIADKKGKKSRAVFRVEIDIQRCKGCELCVSFCPNKHLVPTENRNRKGFYYVKNDPARECSGCQKCALICPDNAVKITRIA